MTESEILKLARSIKNWAIELENRIIKRNYLQGQGYAQLISEDAHQLGLILKKHNENDPNLPA